MEAKPWEAILTKNKTWFKLRMVKTKRNLAPGEKTEANQ
jgi:hypothetical protein